MRKLTFNACCVLATILLAGSAQGQIPVPVLHYNFASVSGTTVNNDGAGGSAMNGALNGTATITNVGGNYGTVLSVPGVASTDGSVRVPSAVVPLNIQAGSAWTVACWIKSTTQGGTWMYQGDGAWAVNNTTFAMLVNNGAVGVNGHAAGGVRYANGWEQGTTVVDDGNWHHIAFVWDGTNKMQYVDGVLDTWVANQWNNTPGVGGQFWIGGGGPGGEGDGQVCLNGLLAQPFVFNTALSQSEVQSLVDAVIPVVATVKPAAATVGQSFKVTAIVTPGAGTVTNVSVNLTALGGAAAVNLVLSNANVYTNTFVVLTNSATAVAGTTNLIVTATQDTQPSLGFAFPTFTVAAQSPPTIVKDTTPTNVFNAYVGQGVILSASFSGAQPITYSWQVSLDSGLTFSDIPGATNTTYTIPSLSAADNGAFYQLQASNQYGSTLSTFTVLQVNSGTPTYTWSAPISFAGQTAEQILTNFPSNYKIAGALVAKNGGTPITVTLTNAGNQPVVFAGDGNWTALSGGTGFFTGANTNLTGNANFDGCLNRGYNDNATHTITLSNLVVGQQYVVQLFGLDNRSGLNPGANSRYVNWQDPADANDTAETFAMNDNVYTLGTFTASNSVMSIQQNMLVSSSGNFNCLVLRTVGWNPPPYFASQPVNVSGFLGTNVSLSAIAAGDTTIPSPTITYQWESGPSGGPYTALPEGAKYAGTTTPALTISNLIVNDGASVYVLAATNGGGGTISREVSVFVQAPPVPPAPGSFGAVALADNPAAFWQLNETNDPSSGLLTAYDFSGSGHSGTYGRTSQNGFNGIMGPTNYPGFAANQGALQSGTANASDVNSVVTVPSLNLSSTSVDTTITMWIKPNATVPTSCGLLMCRPGTAAQRAGLTFAGNQSGGMTDLGYNWNDTQATWGYNSPLYVPLNIWSFVALVVQSNKATLYLDYVDANGQTHLLSAVNQTTHTPATWNTGPTWLGGDSFGGGANRVFPGDIADAAIYNSALTSGQILKLFGAGAQVQGFAPVINTQPPEYTTNYTGFSVQISASVGGTPTVTNQWQLNGANLVDGYYSGTIITGSQSNVLTLANVSTNWEGTYNLTLSNAFGGIVSSNANLVIVSPQAPPAANLVGQWLAGTTSFADVSGYSPAGTHDGYLIGTNYAWSSDVPRGAPAGSKSLSFNNVSLVISNSSTLVDATGSDTNLNPNYTNTFDVAISNSCTVTFWAKGAPGAYSWNPWMSKYGENGQGWQVRTGGATDPANNPVPCWTTRGNSGTYVLGCGPSWSKGGDQDDLHTAVSGAGAAATYFGVDNKWHHYAATFDVSTGLRNLYVDGVLRAQETGNGQYTTSPASHVVIGGRDSGGNNFGNYYTGLIYDVRIYGVAFNGAEVVYLSGPPPAPPLVLGSSVTPASGGNPGQMVLNWLNGGTLLQATNLVGPWTTNTSATPPYTVLMTNQPTEFFKVLFP